VKLSVVKRSKKGYFSDWLFSVNREWSRMFFVIHELFITVICDWYIISVVNCEMSVMFSVKRKWYPAFA
jgi:hypothetical protein